MTNPRTALVLLALAAMAFPAGASAKAPVFKVTVKGSQVTTWGQHHAPQFACDATVDGSGSQLVRFESDPVKLTIVKAKGALPVLAQPGDEGAKYGAPELVPATAMADREGAQDIDAPGGACNGEGGWNGETIPKDCGRRFGAIGLRIGYGLPYSSPAQSAAYKDVLTVTGHYDQFAEVHDSSDPSTFVGDPLGHTYENCPYWSDGPASPAVDELLAAGERHPLKKLAALKTGKSKTISGDERMRSASGDFYGETLTTWNLKLKRVK